jgi:hypothetical protein
MITIKKQGDYKKANSYLEKLLEIVHLGILDKYGKKGVEALKAATPKESGKTANSWFYEISHSENSASITWSNSNTNQGYNIAILIQYGHGTGTGGYVRGTDYVNPAMKDVFEEIANEVVKEIKGV